MSRHDGRTVCLDLPVLSRVQQQGSNNLAVPLLAPPTITTDRLLLRQFALADIEPYARMCSDAEVMRYVGDGQPISAELTWRTVAGFLGHWRLLGYGMWALTRRSDGALLGRVGFIDPPGWPGFELGYLLGREHWGQGYAREGATAALKVATKHLGRTRAISLIRPANGASVKLAQAIGGTFEKSVEFMNGPALVYVYRGH